MLTHCATRLPLILILNAAQHHRNRGSCHLGLRKFKSRRRWLTAADFAAMAEKPNSTSCTVLRAIEPIAWQSGFHSGHRASETLWDRFPSFDLFPLEFCCNLLFARIKWCLSSISEARFPKFPCPFYCHSQHLFKSVLFRTVFEFAWVRL
jgi:hypothetical protein